MTDNDGTYSALMELQQGKPPLKSPSPKDTKTGNLSEGPSEDITTTPYISQNYRFTEDELRWLRLQVFRLRERLGTKVSQNTILRIALAHLREACDKNPRNNALIDAISHLKK